MPAAKVKQLHGGLIFYRDGPDVTKALASVAVGMLYRESSLWRSSLGDGGTFVRVGECVRQKAFDRRKIRMMAGNPGLAMWKPGEYRWAVWILLIVGLLPTYGSLGCRGDSSGGVPIPRRIVDLSPPITEDLAVRQLGHRACEFLGVPERFHFTPVVPANPDYAFGLTRFELVSHIGAHVDAPGRLLADGARADQLPLAKLYGPAAVLDLRWKDRHSPLQVTDLENYSSQIGKNRILILYVGYSQPRDEDWPAYPPISVEAARWLAERGIRALATDMPSIGSFSRYADLMDKGRPPEDVWAERLEFLKRDIPIIEGLTNLGKILGEEKIVFAGFPLPIADRSGAPVRAVALIF